MKILLAVALIPSILLLYYIYKKDRVDKEPARLLIKLFGYGALITIVAIFLEKFLESFWGRQIYYYSNLQYAFYDAFLTVAIVEEGVKYFVLRRVSFNNPNFNCSFDGIIYAVFVSLGFATIENIMYVFNYGLGTGIARAILSVPGHMNFAIFMGVYYSEAKKNHLLGNNTEYITNSILSLFIPFLVHGFYDFCLTSQSDTLYGCFFIFVIIIDIICFKVVKKRSIEDKYF